MSKVVDKIRSFLGFFWSSKFWLFFAVVLLCSGIVVYFQVRSFHEMEKNYKAIIERSNEVLCWDVKDTIKTRLNITRYCQDLHIDVKQAIALQGLINDAIEESVLLSKVDLDHNTIVQAKADIMYEELNALLRLHNEDIQNDYETMELWCGLLTIVFLVFSFFSLYKTDELVRQGEAGLERLNNVEIQAKNEIATIQKEIQEDVNNVKVKVRGELNAEKVNLIKSNGRLIADFQQELDRLKEKEKEISSILDSIKKNLFIFDDK